MGQKKKKKKKKKKKIIIATYKVMEARTKYLHDMKDEHCPNKYKQGTELSLFSVEFT